MENSTIETHVTTVSALSRSALFYDITRGNEDHCFFINHHTGVINTRKLLDFEVCCPMSFIVVGMSNKAQNNFLFFFFLAANYILLSSGACPEHDQNGG